MQHLVVKKTSLWLPILLLLLTPRWCEAVPTNSYVDPNPVYSTGYADRMPNTRLDKNDLFNVSFKISPYHQHASGGRNGKGKKVNLGDRLGTWNMLGIFYGRAAMNVLSPDYGTPPAPLYTDGSDPSKTVYSPPPFLPAPAGGGIIASGSSDTGFTKNYNPYAPQYPYIAAAYAAVRADTPAATPSTQYFGGTQHSIIEATPGTPPAAYLPNNASQYTEAPDQYFDLLSTQYPSGVSFLGNDGTDGNVSVNAKFERVGLRTDLSLFTYNGFSMSLRGGITQYRFTPVSFTALAAAASQESGGGSSPTPDAAISTYLTTTHAANVIANELGLDINAKSVIALEDTFIKFAYSPQFDMPDKKGSTVFKLSPYLSVGCWIPTGQTKDPKAFFSVPTGNNGHWGGVFEGGLSFDFLDTIEFGINGGVGLFNSRTILNVPCASSYFQSSLYPFTANISVQPGISWDLGFSFRVNDFIKGLHFYADYTFSQHHRDTIKVNDNTMVSLINMSRFNPNGTINTNATNSDGTINDNAIPDPNTDPATTSNLIQVKRSTLFLADKMAEDTEWSSVTVNAGINCTLSPNCELGLGVQSHISGARVFKNTTIMGTIAFIF